MLVVLVVIQCCVFVVDGDVCGVDEWCFVGCQEYGCYCDFFWVVDLFYWLQCECFCVCGGWIGLCVLLVVCQLCFDVVWCDCVYVYVVCCVFDVECMCQVEYVVFCDWIWEVVWDDFECMC